MHVFFPSTAKAMLISADMGESVGKLATQKLLTKTETRFQSEHSVMGGPTLTYTTTVLSAHFIVGPTPSNLSKFRPDKLKSNAVETLGWTRNGAWAQGRMSWIERSGHHGRVLTRLRHSRPFSILMPIMKGPPRQFRSCILLRTHILFLAKLSRN